MARQIGLKEVAEMVGVSVSTVSRAYSGDPRVNAETRRRILAAGETLRMSGYETRATLRPPQTRCVGLVQPAHDLRTGDTEVSIQVHASIQQAAERTGHALVSGLLRTTASGAAALGMERGLELDGVIGYRLKDEDAAGFTSAARLLGLPFVLLNRQDADPGVPTCTADHAHAGRLAAEHLLGLEHRHIGVILNELSIQSTRLRLEGVRQTLASQGLMLKPHLTHLGVTEPGQVRQAAEALVGGGATAVIVAHDRLGLSVLSQLASMGVSVPEQMSVVSFDGTPSAAISHPPLTSIYTPWAEMADTATQLLGWLKRDTLLGGAKLTWTPRLHRGGSSAAPYPKARS